MADENAPHQPDAGRDETAAERWGETPIRDLPAIPIPSLPNVPINPNRDTEEAA